MIAEAPIEVLKVINWTLLNEIIPSEWRVARLVMLRKEGKPQGDPAAFRPVHLLSAFSKLWEGMLGDR